MNRKQRRAAKANAARPSADALHAEALALAVGNETAALARAVPVFRKAAAIRPHDADIASDLGAALRSLGQAAEALAVFDRAIALAPAHARAFHNRGLALRDLGRPQDAARSYLRSLAVRPDDPETRNNLGVVLDGRRRHREAAALFESAAVLTPGKADVLNNLGAARIWLGDYAAGLACCERAITLDPTYVEARTNLGTALFEQGSFGQAEAVARAAIAIDPGSSVAFNNLGVALQAQGRTAGAKAAFRRALAIRPDFPQAHYNLGTTLLQEGDYAVGWAEYEWRWKGGVETMVPPDLGKPEWTGGPLEGRTLLFHAEQGLGDVLHFVRFAPLLAARGARVLVQAYPPLIRLLRSMPGLSQVVATGDPLPDFDCHLPMMSAPLRLGITRLSAVPAAVPYLAPTPDLTAFWAQRLQTLTGSGAERRIGLVWSGDPRPHDPHANAVDRRRSIAPELLKPLLRHPGIRFVSLQKGRATAALAALPDGMRPVDPMPDVRDFADTAAIIANLDLVITVDTSVAHLAGAMGKPVWILSRHDGCWRWLLDRDDSPWYPTARLFRQGAPGDWAGVIERVSAALTQGMPDRQDIRTAAPRPDRIAAASPTAPDTPPSQIFADALRAQQAGRNPEALAHYRRLLDVAPDHAPGLHNLGLILLGQGDAPEAARLLKAALSLRAGDAETHYNLGVALQRSGRAAEAAESYRRALDQKPDFAEAANNLGTALMALRRIEEAEEAFRAVLALSPDHPEAHYNLGANLLLQGRLEEGWPDYEWRWRGGTGSLPQRVVPVPDWRGQPPKSLDGTTVLLTAEQGLGDVLQFSRFAITLAARGARVLLSVPESLQRLLQSVPGVDRVLREGDPVPAGTDVTLPLMSVAAALGVTLDSLPAGVPYVSADPALVARWQSRLPRLDGVAIGLVWSGAPQTHGPDSCAPDLRRSIPLSRLLPLLRLKGASFVSLQKGPAASDLRTLPPEVRVTDPMDGVVDFADTAAIIARLDLVITIDTSVAHLAGAMGKPVWILNRFDGCWRWLRNRDDSPWYPTARLFRQNSPGDWSSVVADLEKALTRHLEERATIDRRFTDALRLHRDGDLGLAEFHYRDILAISPRHGPSLYNLGLLSLQKGDYEVAAERIAAALAADPGNAEAATNLGSALMELGRFADAAAAFRKSLSLRPDDGRVFFNLSQALARLGRQDEALSVCRTALALIPFLGEAWTGLTHLLAASGRAAKAVAAARRARALTPADPRTSYDLGNALTGTGALAEARTAFEESIRLAPDFFPSHGALSMIHLMMGRPVEAEAAGRATLALDPDNVPARSNIAAALFDQGRFAEALAAARGALILQPDFALAYNGLAVTLQALGRMAEARTAYRRCLHLTPDYAEAHHGLGTALLQDGDYPAGWREYEWRWRDGEGHMTPRPFPGPVWDGGSLAGKTILLHGEQGLGDVLQFARFASVLAQGGARVVLEVYAPLVRLLTTVPGVDAVVATGAPLPAYDTHLPMMSVPDRLGLTVDGIPATVPYVAAPPARIAFWRDRLAGLRGLKVGLVWAGNPRPDQPRATLVDGRRSVALSRLTPVLTVPGVSFVSLQKGGTAEQLDDLAPDLRPFDPMAEVEDFADTAAIVANLDLVIAVDTSVVHLVGAMGKPVWILNRFDGCWRWFKGRSDSPWYPTARLFNQPAPGDWDSVVREMAGELRHLTGTTARPDAVGAAGGETCDRNPPMAPASLPESAATAAEFLNVGLSGTQARRPVPLAFSQARRPAPGGDGPDGSDETLATDPAGAGADRNDGDEAGRRLRAAIASHEAGHLDAAEADYRAALAIRPDYPEVLTNLGCLLRAKGRLEEAVALQLDVAKRWPGFPAVFNNLGVAWKDLNRPAEAVGAFRTAIRLKPDYAQAHANLGVSLLLAGQFREGWSEYEWRWLGGIRNLIPRPFPSPLWTGGDLTGRRLLLHAEQGHGDAIHFSRYAALAAARGATVILEVHPGLKRLLATVPGVSDVIAGGDPLPAFDCHLPLLSAPHRFGTTLADIPADCPYVSADPALAASWGRRLPRGPGLLAGVVWAGDARRHDPVANAIDRRRSMALAAMRPLLSLPGIRFVSLQMGPAAGEIADLPAAIRPLDPMTEVGDFADTAAIIANLDLVITVDTSVAHLAGAMGKPVWILSRFDGCWRWLTERDDTPWYPTARLFRQTCPGDWTGVIARVADALGTLTGSDNSAIPPSKGLAPASPMPADEVSRLFREAVTHHAQGAFDTAEVFYLTLLAGHLVGPGHAEAHNNLGLLHRQCGRSMAALENFHRAILLRPDYADAHNNLGLIFSDLGETALAVRCHRNSLILDPGSAQVLSNLGVALQETGQIPDAIAAYRRALVLEPALAGTHYNLGLALLLTGDLAEGWREHEWAWRGGVPEARPRHLSAPRWTGQDIAGKTLLFYGEQGLGDVLQFVRYSAGIAARGARVIIEVQPPLRRLLASVPGVSQVIAAGEPVPPADLSLPMMGAPCLFGTTLDTVPADGPYVTADPETVAAWRHRLASLSGVRVGLVWAGAPRSDDPRAHAVDRRRSIGLRHLQPLLRRAGVSFVSLQKGDAARQIVDLPLDLRPFDPMGGVVDFADTAAIIANLDLVITVDTSVAHLAGAMGTPVWILSRFDGCWRWLTDRDDSPWYPSARLFRQMVPGDWDSVIARVGEALTTAVAGKAGRTGPANGEASLPVPPLPRQVPPPRHRSPTEMERIGRLFADAIRLFEAGHMAEAAPLYRTILSLDPDHVDARHHLGLTALKEHRLEEAAKTIADALALRPDNPEATSNLGVVRLNQGRLAEARDLFRRAALIKPDYATALSNWASTLGELEQWEQATMACRQAIAVAPAFAEAYANLGVVLSETGRLTEAESSFRTALRLGPDHVEPHYNLATVLLAQGRYREGWAEYEWRRRGDDPEVAPRELPGPEWSGQPLHGKTLLLYPEQGFGDLLQFCRYASLFAARGASVILESYRGLARLLATLSGVSRVVIKGDPLPPFDYHLSVMSAPFRLGTQGDTIPSRVPYLRADPEAVAAWRDRIAALPGLKAGLVWSGDPRPHDRRAHATDRRRSLRLEQMRPILDCAGVSFVSLQKGAAAGQMEGLPEGRRPVDWMEAVTDFADTAAIVANLDLVITVDTSVAHLAGALGKPVWILSRFAGCWRWLENREDSPWYPNARIFGQPARGSWAPVVQRVADELRSLVAARPATGRTIDAPGTARPEPRPTGPFAEALAHHRAGRLEAAATGYRKVLAHDPGHFDSLHHLGLIALWSGHAAEAIQWISQALLHERSHVGAHLNLAHALLQTGQAAAALLTLRMAADLQPEDAEDLYRLGALLHDLDRAADAAAAYRQALSVRPDVAMAWTNLGGALGELEHHEAAIAACGRALAVDRGQVRACANMGASLHELGRIKEAVALYRDALAVAPDLAETRHNLGTALLSRGLYDEGWQNYEWRWKGLIAGLTPIRPERPVWNGEDLAGRTLLLRREQGLGDVLQFARFAGVLAARGARVLIEAYPPLARLLATVPGVAGVVSDGDPRPVADVELPLLSVPSRLGTTVETIPADVPYLFADEAARDIWRQRLSGLTGIKVGLVWAGDPRTHNVRNHAIDRRRSIALSRLIPLLTLPGLSIVSLQKGEAAVAEMDALPPDLRPFDPMDEVEDFADTAAIVANLDLVITVDTSVAHLAGGMGRPVWILNRFNGCWRWLDGRDDSPWYPTARLFRQTRAGDWDGVVARVVQALSEFAGQAAPPPTERLFAEAVGHHAAHRLDEADALYRRILARDPAEPVVLHHRGVIALQREAPADACAAIHQSLCLSPAYGEAWTNLATAQRDLGDRPGAEASLRRATLLLPRHAEPLNNLGSLVQEQGRLDEAIALFRSALALCPDHPEIHCNLGAALLQDGQYPEGWAEHEWRLHPGAGWSQRDAMAGPVWDGGPLAGKTLLLWSEQGLGDDIQFARFAAPIAALGARVLLEAPAPLARLFATVPGVSGVVVRGGELPPFDVHLSAMSAPYRLGVTLTDLPARIPYLRPDPDLVTHWSERLAHLPGLKVGLVWAGDPRPHDRRAAAIDRRRSMPLAALAPVLSIAGISFISLQMGDAAAQIGTLRAELRPFDPMADVGDLMDTAAIVANLDLVVTVDTAVAHLAGAMGKPVRLLSRFDGCWRWLQNRDDSPWYPTLRLIRQTVPGDWDGVVARLARDLERLAAGPGPAPVAASPVDLPLARAIDLHRAGRIPEAEALYRAILTQVPDHSFALHHLGMIRQSRDGNGQGLPLLKRAVTADPTYAEALNNLGAALAEAGAPEQAADCCRRSVILRPDYAKALSNLGKSLKDLGRPRDAALCYRRALALEPGFVMGLSNLGAALQDLERLEEARDCCRRALMLEPGHPIALNNLGVTLMQAGDDEGAAIACDRAVTAAPDYAEAHVNLGMALLLRGDFARGWAEYDWRWRGGMAALPDRRLDRPRWSGEDLSGRTLLFHGEQGLGDVLHFVRFALPLARLGARVLVEAHAPLKRLLATVPGVSGVLAFGETLPPFDFHLPMLSAPLALAAAPATWAEAVPYLKADPVLTGLWGRRLSCLSGLKVGLVWAGNPRPHDPGAHLVDRRRSLPLAALTPLLAMPGLSFVSLQLGDAAREIEALPPDLRPTDPTGDISDFADTAAIVANLDLVISVDTSVVHLTGAMGKPVWVMSRFDGCWRWLKERDDSPWYPTLRLFRQAGAGDWTDVVAAVMAALQNLRPPPRRDEAGTPAARFSEAVTHHQAGWLDAAEAIYRDLLDGEPNNIGCLYHLGVLRGQRGDATGAIALLRRAADHNGSIPGLHLALADALSSTGAIGEAIAAYRDALTLAPDLVPALYNLGNALLAGGDTGNAARCFRQAVQCRPDLPEPYNNLGNALSSTGAFDEAGRAFAHAAALRPDIAAAHNNLGNIRKEQGRETDAAACFHTALSIDPGYVEARYNLANLLLETGDADGALRHFRQVIALRPDLAEAYNNFGSLMHMAGDLDQAALCYRRCLAIAPDFTEAHANLGTVWRDQGSLDQADAAYRTAIALNPGYGLAHTNLGVTLLLRGEFEEGLAEYEWRSRKGPGGDPRRYDRPLWSGQPLAGRTLLLHCEQGLGDALHFARYVPILAGMGASVVLEAYPPLVRLFSTLPGLSGLVPAGAALPAHDFQLPLMSIAHRLGTRLDSIPGDVPYLSADPVLSRRWAARLSHLRGLKVGLVWAGDPRPHDPRASAVDRRRSVPLERLARLLPLPGASFVSLQKGQAARALETLPQALRPFDPMAEVSDFADTAAIIANLDLVITVDTSVAHLAGAMGRPVWILSRFDGCWRWLQDRDDSPWYPTARLFRQPSPGDWDAVAGAVGAALSALLTPSPTGSGDRIPGIVFPAATDPVFK